MGGYLHFVLVSRWVYFDYERSSPKAATYTSCWCRARSNFGTEFSTVGGLPTLRAGVALGLFLTMNLQAKKWLPTLRAGVVLRLFFGTSWGPKGDYLHFVLVSRWCCV